MPELAFQISLLGPWRLTANGQPVRLRSREQRLVAILALRRSPTRADLAETLWSASTRQQALGSLRSAVFNLRREAPGVIGEQGEALVLSDRVRADVDELMHHLKQAYAPECSNHETTIAALDVPDLLTGWYDPWVEEARESLCSARLEALTTIAKNCLGSQPEIAHTAAAAASVLDGIAEEPCELLIRALLVLGERLDAIQEYERFRQRLLDEMGVEPSDRLRRLAYAGADGPSRDAVTAHGQPCGYRSSYPAVTSLRNCSDGRTPSSW